MAGGKKAIKGFSMFTREVMAWLTGMCMFRRGGEKPAGKASVLGLFVLLLGFLPATGVQAATAEVQIQSYTWSPETGVNGATISFTAAYKNNGPNTATGVTLRAFLPSNVTFSTAPAGCTLYATPQAPAPSAPYNALKELACVVSDMAFNEERTLVFAGVASVVGDGDTRVQVATTDTDNNASNDYLNKIVTVIAGADLDMGDKTPSATSLPAGSTLTYTLAPRNLGPDATGAVRVIDTLPPTADFDNVTASGTNWSCLVTTGSNPTATCNYTGAAKAASEYYPEITVQGRIAKNITGTISNSASIDSTDANIGDGNSANINNLNPATGTRVPVVVTVTSGTAIAAVKSMPGGTTVSTGATGVIFRIGARNDGPQAVGSGPGAGATITVTDTIPTGWAITSVPSGCDNPVGTQNIACTISSLAAGATQTFDIVATSPGVASSAPHYSNTANIVLNAMTDTGGANTATVTPIIVSAPYANLVVTKSKTAGPIQAGQLIANTITVGNSASSLANATSPITVTDDLQNYPDEVYDSFSGAGWTCVTRAGFPQYVDCTYVGADLAPGATLPLTINTRASGILAGPITLTNQLCPGSSHSPAPSSQSCVTASTTGTPRQVDLGVTKTANPAPATHVLVGDDTFTYTIVVSNRASGIDTVDTVPTVTVSDPIRVYYSGAAGTTQGHVAVSGVLGVGESCNANTSGSFANLPSTLVCTLKDLAQGTSRTLTVTVKRPFLDGTIDNTVTVSSPDAVETTNTLPNTATAQVIIDPIVDPTIAIATTPAPPNTVQDGVEATVTVAINNRGPSTANSVVVKAPIDTTYFDYVAASASFTGSSGSCSYMADMGADADGNFNNKPGVKCTGFDLSNGLSRQLTFRVMPRYPVATAADYPFRANISTSSTEGSLDGAHLTNNLAGATLTVVNADLDLRVLNQEKIPPGDPVGFTENIVYQVSVVNDGPSLATNVVLVDTPQAPTGYELTYASFAIGAGSTYTPPSPTCTTPGGGATEPVTCKLHGTDAALNYLPANKQVVFELTFSTGPGASTPGTSLTFNSTATVSSDETLASPTRDRRISNNTASENTTVLPLTDLRAKSKAVQIGGGDVTVVNINQPFNYVVKVYNFGPSNSLEANFADTLPSGIQTAGAITVAYENGGAITTNTCGAVATGSASVACKIGPLPASDGTDTSKVAVITIPVKAARGTYTGPFDPSTISNRACMSVVNGTALDRFSNDCFDSPNHSIRKSSLAGNVYNDANLSGGFNASEGLNVSNIVTLSGTDAYGNVLSITASTSGDGAFLFDNLPPADSNGYTITETQPSGYFDSKEVAGSWSGSAPADVGGVPTAGDYGSAAAQNRITGIKLPAGAVASGYLFEEYQALTLEGYVYHDANNNGLRSGESGIGAANQHITLTGTDYSGAAVSLDVTVATSGSTGRFQFTNVPPASFASGTNYTITQVSQPAGYLDGKDQNGAGVVVDSSSGRAAGEAIIVDKSQLTIGASLSERNFGELLPATLSGYVFVDIDSDAVRDAGETAGATGVTVRLSGIDDLSNTVGPPDTTTGANGGYSFTGLRPGTYAVTQASAPAGLTHTGAQAGANGGTISGSVRASGTPVLGLTVKDISAIAIAANDSAINYNFGESGQGLAGFVYVDLNNNGIKDAGEPGIPGVSVTLSGLTSGGVTGVCTAISPNPCTVTTDASGAYSYINLPASDSAGYTLAESGAVLNNYVDGGDGASPTSAGSLGGTRGNDVLSGIVLPTGGFGTDYNFGEQGASLSGRVYHDRDDNGAFNGSDSGILGVRVTLSGTKVGGGDACADLPSNWCVRDSAADGTFSVTGLPAGSYTLTETQPVDYANRTTAAGTPAGTSSTGTTISGIPLTTAGASGTGYLFGEKTGTIAGFVWHDVNNDSVKDVGETTGISGVTLTLSGFTASGINVCAPTCPSATSGADGSYTFTGLFNADGAGYTIAETTQPAGYLDGLEAAGSPSGNTAVNDRISAIPFSAASPATGYNFGEVLGTSISGKVWHDFASTAHPLNRVKDADEPGLGAVTITLTGANDLGNICNPTCPTSTTAADGTYSFTGLRPGTYAVTETQPSGINDFSTNTGTLVGSVNSGTVGNAGAGANVISAIVLASGEQAINYDFREDAALFVGGYVYLDVNGSGDHDAGDSGIADVTLTLTGGTCADGTSTCTTTTASDGSYLFAGLRAGTYAITETHPVIYEDFKETAGSLSNGVVDNSDYDTTATLNRITGINVTAGSQLGGYNFGELNGVLAQVSGRAWINTNTSGRRTAYDAGDTVLAGWTVELVHGGSVVASTSTGSYGTYSITAVTPNYDYSVRFRNPANNLTWGYPVANGGVGTVNASTAAIESITVPSNGAITGLDLPIDPAGVVYDAISRAPVAGAVVTLGCPGCVGFDANDVIGDSLTQTTGADGIYQFFLKPTAPSGTYTLSVVGPPAIYVPGVSAIIPQCANTLTVANLPNPALVQDDPNPPVLASVLHSQALCLILANTGGGGYIAGSATTLYFTSIFISTIAPTSGNLINNHLPIDPILGGAIRVTKTTPLINVAKGDLVPYTITATNTLVATLPNINLQDLMPPGFKYKTGSAKLNGVLAEPTINARQLTWANQTFTPNEVKTIKLMLVVGAGVGEGQYTNQAWAINNIVSRLVSNTAAATVRVVPDPTFDCSDLIGKVFDDQNANGYQDEGEPGIANVRVATARGLLVTTDKDGRFHVACADIPQAQRGSNFIMKLDERSLPSGYRLTTENPREVRTTRGKMVKLNFGAAIHRVVRLELTDAAFLAGKPDAAAALADALEKLPATLRVKPSVVRLAYQAGKEDVALAKDRLRAVRERLEELWKVQGCCYTLVFEEEIFERASAKKGGAK